MSIAIRKGKEPVACGRRDPGTHGKVARWQQIAKFAFEALGESLARLRPRARVFDQAGVLWVAVSDPSFGHGIFEMLV